MKTSDTLEEANLTPKTTLFVEARKEGLQAMNPILNTNGMTSPVEKLSSDTLEVSPTPIFFQER